MTPDNAANASKTPAPQSFSPDSPSPSTRSPPAPALGRATLYRNPDLRAVIEEHRARGKKPHTLTGLTTEIAHLRIALDALADNVRRHEEELRRLRKPRT